MAMGSAAPITAASEMRRRWCVKKEVVAIVCEVGPLAFEVNVRKILLKTTQTRPTTVTTVQLCV